MVLVEQEVVAQHDVAYYRVVYGDSTVDALREVLSTLRDQEKTTENDLNAIEAIQQLIAEKSDKS